MELTITDNKVFIPKSKINETHPLEIRIYDIQGSLVTALSTRSKTITVNKDGVVFKCDESYAGCEYKLIDWKNGTVIWGKLLVDEQQNISNKKKE